ncbi:ABC transporter substrate-binding protein [Bradyrhizobium sp. DASA03076]|uniref:ABC transporter substrate-binding protein n=1 Tax=Bradyrhizobium sp. BLXBL-03 TaxID=3395916 RepID=UPI003F725228
MITTPKRFSALVALISLAASMGFAEAAGKNYDTGATDAEIKIGNIMPYSGPASAYGIIGRVEAAYFRKVNDEGGINGRKIDFISYDDSYSPPKTVEQARKLVESDGVLLIFNSLGTPTNSAIQHYMNQKQVPQLFVATGATKWADPEHFPWTMGWQPSYQAEARIYARYIIQQKPDAKIAVLYQNDDYGKDYLKGLSDGLGNKPGMIVAKDSYEVSEPTISSHIVNLKASGADTLFVIATPKFAAQSIKEVRQLKWDPLFILNNVSASVGSVLKPAGLENAKGLISAAYMKDETDPKWLNQPDSKEWAAFLDKYMPEADKTDAGAAVGYAVARTLVHVIKACGDDLTRKNVMKQAANLKSFDPGLLLPGITISTSASDFAPIQQLQLMRFNGKSWELFGPVMNGSTGS